MNDLPSKDDPGPQRGRLRRLSENLRRRDWVGVTVEIAIVALGVLLAFRIEQWGQQRNDARDERQFLERLHSEYGRATEELKAETAAHERLLRELAGAFAVRSSPARLQALSQQEGFGCGGGYLRTAAFNDTIFQELISSGQLSIVSNSELRSQIRDLATEQASLRDRAERGNEAVRDQGPLISPYYRYELEPSGRSTCYVEWERLFKDPLAVTATVRTYRMHELVLRGRRDLLKQTVQVRDSIACTLGRPDCRP